MSVLRVLVYLTLAVFLFIGAVWLSTPDVAALKSTAPADTAFMRLRAAEAEDAGKKLKLRRTWVPYSAISRHLVHAVIVAEDGGFYEHRGVDLVEIEASFRKNLAKGRFARGGSTITQQLAKNLYLSPSKNPVRKLRELFIALELEKQLSKTRILELYLNSIEWGEGVFGAEAAARHYFGVSARSLSAEQAATLAAIIPSPRTWGKQIKSPKIQRKKRIILRRMNRQFGPPSLGKPAPQQVLASETEDEDLHDDAPDVTVAPAPAVLELPERNKASEAQPELQPESGEPQESADSPPLPLEPSESNDDAIEAQP